MAAVPQKNSSCLRRISLFTVSGVRIFGHIQIPCCTIYNTVSCLADFMLDEMFLLQLTTVKLGGCIVSFRDQVLCYINS